jgi:hypothetical protein
MKRTVDLAISQLKLDPSAASARIYLGGVIDRFRAMSIQRIAMRSAIVRLVASTIMLAGFCACVSSEELHAQDEAACRSYGFQPGTNYPPPPAMIWWP